MRLICETSSRNADGSCSIEVDPQRLPESIEPSAEILERQKQLLLEMAQQTLEAIQVRSPSAQRSEGRIPNAEGRVPNAESRMPPECVGSARPGRESTAPSYKV